MKKILILFIAVLAVGLTACKKETIVQETPNVTFYRTILPGDWRAATDGRYYYCDILDQDIQQNGYEHDGIIVSFARFNDNGFDALPFTFGQASYSYTAFPGKIRIMLQHSYDRLAWPDKPSSEIDTKVVLVASQVY